MIGNLIIVSCGHVDSYSKIEELALKNHFRNAGFLIWVADFFNRIIFIKY